MLQKKCKKCLEAEKIPLTDLLFYILKIFKFIRTYPSIGLLTDTLTWNIL